VVEFGALLAPEYLSERRGLSVSRSVELLQSALIGIRQQFAAVAHQPARTLLLGTVLLVSTVSAATGFVLAQYYSVDVLSSLLYPPDDCWLGLPTNIGRHCFNDYTIIAATGMRRNPWDPYPIVVSSHYEYPSPNLYPAAGMVPHVAFGLLGKWLGAPRLGLLGYLLVLTIACLTPAVWAARGARGLERVVVFVACGAAAVPAWLAMDRGNSVGFVVPITLVFLVALCRQRWGLVAAMVVLAALVKPQFVVLAVALLVARQWRLGGIAVVGAVISNLAAYLLWPRDFPQTIVQSIQGTLGYGNFESQTDIGNISFGRALLVIPDTVKLSQTGGRIPDGFLAGPRSLIGYGILMLVVVSVLALGRRIPPVMAGIALLATASLFPAVTWRYYLVFALPVAALVVRDPDGPPGSGIFDRFATLGDRRRALGICVSLAAALSIAQIAVPTVPILVPTGQQGVIGIVRSALVFATTAIYTPFLWLMACAAIVISYARRPVTGVLADPHATSVLGTPIPTAASQANSD
jgi:hypothetical protein